MRTEKEIQEKIQNLRRDLYLLEDWVEKAQSKYEDDRKIWGKTVDSEELNQAKSCRAEVVNQINLLRWIVNETTDSQVQKTTNTETAF